jgi:hypothetical protein
MAPGELDGATIGKTIFKCFNVGKIFLKSSQELLD